MEEKNTCPLCDRPLGQAVEMHHLIPKSQGGRETIPLHPICHRKIHALFNEKELAKRFSTIEALRQSEEISLFIEWLKGKPADFYRKTKPKGGKRRR
ncbi:HNH endonuclease [Kordiimonas lipolytica]|uniref:HNH endonuclease n=1 Tax=Kordiimonas lipolytica TaxID=1662421 RepID=A0ABV8UE55_9PROT|nr:HNH endonuclease [Kordiimonas lipolytica]